MRGGGILLDHGTHLIYQMLDAAGVPPRVRAWTGLLRHRRLRCRRQRAFAVRVSASDSAMMFLTWAARHRESQVRFIGDAGAIDWTGGTLRLERNGAVESFDYSAQLDKSAYPAWFAGLFNAFADAMDARSSSLHCATSATWRPCSKVRTTRRALASPRKSCPPEVDRLAMLLLRIRPADPMLSPRQKLVRNGRRSRIDNETRWFTFKQRDNHGGHAPGAVHRRVPLRR